MPLLVMVCVAWLTLVGSAEAQTVEATAQRPSFTTNTSITHAGTVELETGVQGTRHQQSLPNLLKYTPNAGPLDGRVEFSVAFDAVERSGGDASFGDAVTLYARIPTGERGAASFAVAPFASVPTKGDAGPGEVGGTFITSFAWGSNAATVNVTAAKATGDTPVDASHGNLAFALSRTLPGILQGKLGLYVSGIADVGDHRAPSYSLLEGVTYNLHPRVTLDVSVGQFAIGDETELAVVTGATVNFGFAHR
jgi:hypothetical protein